MSDRRGHVGFRAAPCFDRAGERVEAVEATELVNVPELGRVESAAQYRNRFVVDLERHGEGVTVLPAMREGEARRVVETCRRAVHHFGDERQRLQRARTELLEQEERGEVAQVAFVRQSQHRTETLLVHVVWAHIMMARHSEMACHLTMARRHLETPGRRSAMREGGPNVSERAGRILTRDGEERILCRTCLAIDEVHDL